MKTIDLISFKNKTALIRVDFNVPLNNDFLVTDTSRIEAAKPTISHVLNQGGKVVLMSHLGRPNGRGDEAFSLKHIVKDIEKTIKKPITFIPDCIGSSVEKSVNTLNFGEVALLENLRFYKEETDGDKVFSKALANLGDIYINDAFGTAHRPHASTTIVADYFTEKCFGKLLEKEIKAINNVLHTGQKPITAIIGGSKVSSKITIIENILDKVDHLIIGGGMSFTFIKALGGVIGNSICENDKLALSLDLLKLAKEKNVEIHLPVDVIASDDFSNNANTQLIDIYNIPAGWQGLDAGVKTREKFKDVILSSKTILWNGPVGVFEMKTFANGTIAVGKAVVEATNKGAFSLVGGGDSVAAVKQFGFSDKVSYVSTGGGAMLESLEGKTLPGIQAILNN